MNRIPVIILKDIIDINGNTLTQFPRKGDIIYLGDCNDNEGYCWYINVWDKNGKQLNHTVYRSEFITLAEWREQQIKDILDEKL